MLVSAALLGFTARGFESELNCGREALYSKYGVQQGQTKSPDGKKVLAIETLPDTKNPDRFVSYNVTVGRQALQCPTQRVADGGVVVPRFKSICGESD
jgi:hypothetical protein